jgi:hypothetical protein
MIKRLLSQSITEEEWPIWRIVVFIGAIIVAATIYFLIYFFGPTISDIRGTSLSPTTNRDTITVEVGGTLFSIPANYTRYGRDRRAQARDQLELHALYPRLEGYSNRKAEVFAALDGKEPVILISIRSADASLSADKLLEQIYLPATKGEEINQAFNLDWSNFRADSHYEGAQLYRQNKQTADQTGSDPRNNNYRLKKPRRPYFICQMDTRNIEWCRGQLQIGQTAIAFYRFPKAYLEKWEKIDAGLQTLLSNFRANARKNAN